MLAKTRSAGMVVAMILASAVATAAPAQAAPAPSCVATQTWSTLSWKYARASNYCSSPKRFKFLWAYAFDGTCIYYAVNAQRTENRGTQSRFDGLQLC